MFERCAYIVAETRFAVVESQHRLEGYIPADSIAEVSKVIGRSGTRKRSSQITNTRSAGLWSLVKGDTSNRVSRNVISDLYVKADDGTETYFEIKVSQAQQGPVPACHGKALAGSLHQKGGLSASQNIFRHGIQPVWGRQREHPQLRKDVS